MASKHTPNLPVEWCRHLSKLCKQFEKEGQLQIALGDCASALLSSISTPLMYLIPPVIIWSPLEQLPMLKGMVVCPKCSQPGSILHASGWRDGTRGRRSEPRRIYGENGVTLLVGRVYTCTKGHEVAGYHPGIINKIATCFVPFNLWHVTGFTKQVTQLIFSLITSGLSIHGIQKILSEKQTSWYCNQRLKFAILCGKKDRFTSLSEWQRHFFSTLPSLHAVSGCFLEEFWGKEVTYTKCMQNTSIQDDEAWLSCDHTFASAANVGMTREGDKRWITQYGALFCVLNSYGQVVTWKLATGVAFNVIKDLLFPLKERLKKQGRKLSEFYIDNCCSWRKKLQQVFGEELKVKLDIFHAVKRISDKIPKRHHLRRECMSQWSLVFRDRTDQGEKRSKATPSPAVLESNLDEFLQRWKDAKYDEKTVLNEAALHEISNIRKHMKKGCLSGIKPGRGTNRNESLHKDLNNIMSSSRYGVELAYALFTVCFYKHNERMASVVEKRAAYPIEFYDDVSNGPVPSEHFGLSFEFRECVSGSSTQSLVSQVKLDINSTYAQLYAYITDKPLCHVKKPSLILEDSDADTEDNSEAFSDIEQPMPIMAVDPPQVISVVTAKAILIRALTWYFLHKCISSLSTTASVNIYCFPFLTSYYMVNVFNDITSENLSEKPEQRLDDLLTSWNLRRCPSEDIFGAFGHNLNLQVEKGNVYLQQFLVDNGIATKPSSQVTCQLKRLVFAEWLGENSEDYQEFLTYTQLQEQASLLQDGSRSSEIGDLVILALSNVMKIPIVLFTSAKNMPIAIQLPTQSTVFNIDPVLVAYVQGMPGYFSAVKPASSEDSVLQSVATGSAQTSSPAENTSPPSKGCFCGKKAIRGTPCSYSLKEYTCRCPCYNKQQACSDDCRCKCCGNPYGVRPESGQKTKIGHKRKRFAHQQQSVPLRGKSGHKFMEEVGEQASIGGFSETEFLIVCAIIHGLLTEGSGYCTWDRAKDIDSLKVHSVYTSILDVVQSMGISLPMYTRTDQEISKLLKLSVVKNELSHQYCYMK